MLASVLCSCMVSSVLCATDGWQSNVQVGQGYRRDSLKFNFSGRHHKPNIISELKFKDIDVYLTTLKASLTNGEIIGVLEGAYGDVLHGKVRDSDYLRNNRRGEFSRSHSKVPGKYTIDATAKLGRRFSIGSITCTPSIGYGAFWQHLRIKDGHQVIPRSHHARKGSPIHHLNSSYKTVWSAPFVDLQCSVPLCSTLSLDLGYSFFYPLKYTGKGNWNLRHLHFKQTNKIGKSWGERANINVRWAFAHRFELGAGISCGHFVAKDGKITFKQLGYKGKQPGHRAKRTFTDYVLTLSYAF